MHHKCQPYNTWFLKQGARQTKYFVILGHFLPFNPLATRKIKIMKKWKKTPGDIIILHMCTINENHMMYGSWEMKCNRIFCRFGPFLPFYPTNNLKNENFEKMKKIPGDMTSLQLCTTNDNHIMYGSWDMKCDRIFCHFGAFCCPFFP